MDGPDEREKGKPIMASTLTLRDGEKTYTLEYTRASVRTMESNGFVTDELTSKPMTMIPKLFEGAFIAHHRFMKRDEIQKIYDQIPNKMELFEALVELYNEPMQALLADSEEPAGNVSWSRN